MRRAAQDGFNLIREAVKQTREIISDFAKAGLVGAGAQWTLAGGQLVWPFSSDRPRQLLPRAATDASQIPGYTPEELQALRVLRWHLDNTRNIIVLENMPRGDVLNLITKLAAKKTRLSNRALWAFFECLFKGCVGMATPGRFHEAGLDPNAYAMEAQDETVPDWLHDGTQKPAQPMVHFDLIRRTVRLSSKRQTQVPTTSC